MGEGGGGITFSVCMSSVVTHSLVLIVQIFTSPSLPLCGVHYIESQAHLSAQPSMPALPHTPGRYLHPFGYKYGSKHRAGVAFECLHTAEVSYGPQLDGRVATGRRNTLQRKGTVDSHVIF